MDMCGNGEGFCVCHAILEWRICVGDSSIYGGEMGQSSRWNDY